MENKRYVSIDEYIAYFPADVQKILQELRAAIHAAAPQAEERISYQMPAFWQNGILVYFAAFQHHIGFYPAPNGIEAFQAELAVYGSGKGSVRFPIDQPMPLDLVTRIVKFRVAENLEKARRKPAKRK